MREHNLRCRNKETPALSSITSGTSYYLDDSDKITRVRSLHENFLKTLIKPLIQK
jgi:hypothetical protein